MKQKLSKVVRQHVPRGGVRAIEEVYRRGRVQAVSALYGNPAKSLRVIGVTGTNGKTTTVNYINEILKEAGYTTAMFSTAVIEVAGKAKRNELNATVASTGEMQRFFKRAKQARVDFAILEFPSHALHQHKLDTVPVEVAVMTNLTQDHLDYHGTMENYAAVKGKLFDKTPKFIVLNCDDEWFEFFNQFPAESQKITYGKHEAADVHIDRVKLFRKGTETDLTIDHQTRLELATALPGEFNAYNMVAAASVAYLLGIDLEAISEGIANLESIPGRFDRIEADKGFDVVVDYAHTPDALEKLLQTAKAITKNRVILVFGACGDRDASKRPIMGEIAAKLADRIYLTDEESYNEDPHQIRAQIYKGIESAKGQARTTEISDRRDAIKKAIDVAKKGDTILVTGMGHEVFRIVNGERLPWNDEQVVRELLSEA
ncbi:UDP-N-acetylmuramoyl-L-alanyl-D-glutamate--2,6-diaminopimelate ligase [Candidatus Saccharibacteria bacterium]|nr:UDP-N-acetylmuramoyl-L-alanyl-D-glutamate--2,6-diaminopimelate ligase [Candidatus Saccharibacteria bacterium]